MNIYGDNKTYLDQHDYCINQNMSGGIFHNGIVKT